MTAWEPPKQRAAPEEQLARSLGALVGRYAAVLVAADTYTDQELEARRWLASPLFSRGLNFDNDVGALLLLKPNHPTLAAYNDACTKWGLPATAAPTHAAALPPGEEAFVEMLAGDDAWGIPVHEAVVKALGEPRQLGTHSSTAERVLVAWLLLRRGATGALPAAGDLPSEADVVAAVTASEALRGVWVDASS